MPLVLSLLILKYDSVVIRRILTRRNYVSFPKFSMRQQSCSSILYALKCLKVLIIQWDIVSTRHFLMRHLISEWAIVSMSRPFSNTGFTNISFTTNISDSLPLLVGVKVKWFRIWEKGTNILGKQGQSLIPPDGCLHGSDGKLYIFEERRTSPFRKYIVFHGYFEDIYVVVTWIFLIFPYFPST